MLDSGVVLEAVQGEVLAVAGVFAATVWHLRHEGDVRVFEWIDRPKIETLAKRCVAMIAPYRNVENFTMNLPNKILDGLSLGLPILTSLNGEVERLITEHSVGMRYGEPPSPSLTDCVIRLYQDRDLLESLSSNAKALYEREFRNDYVYGRMSDFLIGLIK